MKSKPFLLGAFAFIIAFTAVSFYFAASVGRPSKTISAIPVSGGKFKAVKITMSNGGATPYCFDSVAVILAVYPDDFAERSKRYEVYSAPCAHFVNSEPSPKIEWLSPTALQITHALGRAGSTSGKHVMNDADVTNTVHVTFVSRD